MSLLISRNGKIQDYTKPNSTKRVQPQRDHEKEQDDGHRDPQREGQREASERSHNAIKSYQKNQSAKVSKILHARDVCSSPVIFLSKADRVSDAMEIMEKHQIHHLPLINSEGIIEGIVSDRDIIQRRGNDRLETHMTSEVLVAKETTEVKIIARMMITNEISALPLINDQNVIVGIITKTDLLECLVRSLPLEQYV